MAGEKSDPSKVDTTPVDIKYEDIPEESRKQFEAALQKEQEEAKKRLLAYFGMTRCWRLPTSPAMTPADANLGWQYFMNHE